MMNNKQWKKTIRVVKELQENQKKIFDTVSPVVEKNRDDIDEMSETVDSISEILDVYFWTLVRAQLDGRFDLTEEIEEDQFRKNLQEELIDLQYEYLVCNTLASFFASL